MTEDDFKQCTFCRPGSVELCESCQHNRDLIAELKTDVECAQSWADGWHAIACNMLALLEQAGGFGK